jgi:hypothetical protein
MNINIGTNRDLIFKQYLSIINTLLPKDKKLSEIEMRVFSRMLQVYYMYLYLGENQANTLVFHKEIKKRIREAIGVELGSIYSQYSFNNVLTSLRRKGFIEGTSIKHKVPYGKKGININISLEIKDGGESSE